MSSKANYFYNPDWLSDESLVQGFVARTEDFFFLCQELSRFPLIGTVQHYLLVGVRGSGKTTMLKRLAVAIRQNNNLSDHLIALSFPEELYQVKNLSDFWWAACEALLDELLYTQHIESTADLEIAITNRSLKLTSKNEGLNLLLKKCEELKRRPVLLVDNLDFIFERIDKSGRKLKDPYSSAYWELREVLSNANAPIIIGGTVRLNEAFTDYDKAFYDFFIPKRLGKLSKDEVIRVLDRLSDVQKTPEVKQRLKEHPSRIEALLELTGGNPRALNIIFELLRTGPNSRAIEDFEKLMDITTPYYKARFEDMSEQSQVIMHALAVRQPDKGSTLHFGHTASEISSFSGVPTSSVSAQLDSLVRDGLVEKASNQKRYQYRIAEQLFRLWLQMRSTRRIRQNVIGLTEFLEAMFDAHELQNNLNKKYGAGALADAQFSFALAATDCPEDLRNSLEALGADKIIQHVKDNGGRVADYLLKGDLSEPMKEIMDMREQIDACKGGGLNKNQIDALIGSINLQLNQKKTYIQNLRKESPSTTNINALIQDLDSEYQYLITGGLSDIDILIFYKKRALGYLQLPFIKPEEIEMVCSSDSNNSDFRGMIWRLLGVKKLVKFKDEASTQAWLEWNIKYSVSSSSQEWASVAGNMRRSKQYASAQKTLEQAFAFGPSSRAWFEQGMIYFESSATYEKAEQAFLESTKLNPEDAISWFALGILLIKKLNKPIEGEAAYRKAISLDKNNPEYITELAEFLSSSSDRFEEAEAAYNMAIKLDNTYERPWLLLGTLLEQNPDRFHDAEMAYRKVIELDPLDIAAWVLLGLLLDRDTNRIEEAEQAYRKAIEINPNLGGPWFYLASLLYEKTKRFDEAEQAYRKAIELEPNEPHFYLSLAILLSDSIPERIEEAEQAYRKAIELDPKEPRYYAAFAILLSGIPERTEEAEQAYKKAIELHPNEPNLYLALASLIANNIPDHYEEAEKALHKVIEIDPKIKGVWNNLGILLADRTERYLEAEAAFLKAIEAEPDDSSGWNNLGILLASKLNQPEDAEKAFLRSIQVEPNDATAWVNLGVLYTIEERIDEACSALKKALEIESDYRVEFQEIFTRLQIKRFAKKTKKARKSWNIEIIRSALTELLNDSIDMATILVSKQFIEKFLSYFIDDKNNALLLLDMLYSLGYGAYGRPLLIAFEAAIKNQPEKLTEIEPEIRVATLKMYDRLMKEAQKRNLKSLRIKSL